MGKRAAHEGSIFQRKDGRWVAQVTFYNEDGRRQRRAFYFATQGQARKKLTGTQGELDRGEPLPVEMMLGAHLAEWLTTKEADLRPESLRRYRDIINLHLIPALGRVKLTKLSPPQIHAAIAQGRAKGLSGTTLQLMHGVLHKALEDAVEWNRVARNAADRVKPPRRSTPEMRTLTPEEAARLLIAAQGDPLEAFYTLALTCGLRLGELQALHWRDVDIDRRRLQVTSTFQGFVEGVPVFAEPKTDKSKRTVHLSDMATGALRTHRTRQIEARLTVGPLWEDHGLVFANGLGRPLDGNNIRTRSFARLLERAGLPAMRFHALRHSAATLLMAEGVPVKVASELLGHGDIATTLRIYSHVLPSMQEAAASAMDRLFSSQVPARREG